MFVDSHCHLDFPELVADLPSLLDAMRDARVTHALCISVDLAAWPGVHALAVAHDNLYATAGVHPDYADTDAMGTVRADVLLTYFEVLAQAADGRESADGREAGATRG